MSKEELINRIYDTLMENVGMTEYNLPFPVENVSNQFVTKDFMYFEIEGKAFQISIKEVKPYPVE